MSALAAGVTTDPQSAASGTDYDALAAATNMVTFAAGEESQTIDLTVKTDTVWEESEQLEVTLSAPSEPRHALDELFKTTVVIEDDDTPGKHAGGKPNNSKLGFFERSQ